MTLSRVLALAIGIAAIIVVSMGAVRLQEPIPLQADALAVAPIQPIRQTESPPSETSSARVALVWARLLEAAAIAATDAPALVFDRDAIAHSQGSGELFFGPSVTALPEDEIAFVLAHELSHFLLGHHGAMRALAQSLNASDHFDHETARGTLRAEHWLIEFEADARAQALLARAGFDRTAAARYLGRQNLPDGRTHPSTARRAEILGRL